MTILESLSDVIDGKRGALRAHSGGPTLAGEYNKEKLAAILKYHVVPGKIAAADAKGAAVDLTTLNGAIVKVDGKGEVVKVGDATVTSADIIASNGVIHLIDTVIMPPAAATTTE